MRTIVFVGDSITEGAADHEIGGWSRRLAAKLPASWRAVHAGVGGDTITLILERLERDVLAHQPQVIVLAVGINDSRTWSGVPEVTQQAFAGGLQRFAACVRAALPETRVLVVGLTPLDESRTMPIAEDLYYAEAAGRDYDAVLQRSAAEHGWGYVPLQPRFEQAGGAAALTSDGLHPTPDGHALIAAAVAEALEPWLP
ncbi:MAG: hypothetical protein KIT46_08640 [Anaerolineales bacterium]|nr:hypothetical protein [Anaerolineales bacterium]MCW5856097.1 hypothetical protein [Anaerolineales bacterium]